MKEREKILKKGILESYCRVKPSSIVEELRMKLGDDVTIQLLDYFSGRAIYLPEKSSLRRAVQPMLIRQELKGFESGSDLFKIKVKNLSKYYKLTQKAVIKINKRGIFAR